jgi:hypothetical protein
MSDQPERMTRDEIKEFIFDDLVEFLEETGNVSAVTPDEIAALVDETPGRVKGCMLELVREGVLVNFKDEDGTLYFQFDEDTLSNLLDEMREAGWTPPDDDDSGGEDLPI